jgi:hypothetical protein
MHASAPWPLLFWIVNFSKARMAKTIQENLDSGRTAMIKNEYSFIGAGDGKK